MMQATEARPQIDGSLLGAFRKAWAIACKEAGGPGKLVRRDGGLIPHTIWHMGAKTPICEQRNRLRQIWVGL